MWSATLYWYMPEPSVDMGTLIVLPPPPPPPPQYWYIACVYIVRSESLTCTFRTSCCSARLSRAQVLAFAGSSGEGMRGNRLHWQVLGSICSPTGVGNRRRILWNYRIKPKQICAHFSEENWAQFGRSVESKRELRNILEVAQIGPSWC